MTGKIVYSWEYDILMCMDAAFCLETNLELESERVKREEAREAELNRNRRGG